MICSVKWLSTRLKPIIGYASPYLTSSMPSSDSSGKPTNGRPNSLEPLNFILLAFSHILNALVRLVR
ncbi:hypothetical protein LINPERHAP1_LOCUS26659 [Linum perenne]